MAASVHGKVLHDCYFSVVKTKILKFDSTFGVNLIAYGVFIQYHLIISCHSEPLKPWPKNFTTFRCLPSCHNMREFWQSVSQEGYCGHLSNDSSTGHKKLEKKWLKYVGGITLNINQKKI